ncbi:hypothetical protein KAT92_02125 [Candidatus Babeliales bacterium]|nr:hypothetical protein [Candidatus Babeliales bacterium]
MKKLVLMLVLGIFAVGMSSGLWCAKNRRQENIKELKQLHESTRVLYVGVKKSLRQQNVQGDKRVLNLSKPLQEKIEALTKILNNPDIFRMKKRFGLKGGFNNDSIVDACNLVTFFQEIKKDYENAGLLYSDEEEDLNNVMDRLKEKARNISLDSKAVAVGFKGLDIGA